LGLSKKKIGESKILKSWNDMKSEKMGKKENYFKERKESNSTKMKLLIQTEKKTDALRK